MSFDAVIHQKLKQLSTLSSDQIEDKLPLFFAYDIDTYKTKHPEKKIVIFLDTYEALWANKRTQANELTEDQWIRDGLVSELQHVLFVICGRERLVWEKDDSDWRKDLNQHIVGDLSDTDARDFLQSCDIDDTDIQNRIIEDSEGVPYYLDLCVDTYYQIKNQHKTPTVDDFQHVGKAAIFERFMRYLSTNEAETLKALACPRFYNAEIFSLLVETFKTGYPISAMTQLSAFSFIHEDKGKFQIHDLMRESLLQHNNEHKQQADQLLFDHYNRRLQKLDIKNISEANQQSFPEACYHKMQLGDIESLMEWYVKPFDSFEEAAQYKLLLESSQQIIVLLEASLDEDHIEIAYQLHRQAGLFESIAKYEEAEPLYQRCLSITEKALGKDHPSVATTLNNLAGLYESQGKYEEAEPLYQRAITLMEGAFPKGHPNLDVFKSNYAAMQKKWQKGE